MSLVYSRTSLREARSPLLMDGGLCTVREGDYYGIAPRTTTIRPKPEHAFELLL